MQFRNRLLVYLSLYINLTIETRLFYAIISQKQVFFEVGTQSGTDQVRLVHSTECVRTFSVPKRPNLIVILNSPHYYHIYHHYLDFRTPVNFNKILTHLSRIKLTNIFVNLKPNYSHLFMWFTNSIIQLPTSQQKLLITSLITFF